MTASDYKHLSETVDRQERVGPEPSSSNSAAVTGHWSVTTVLSDIATRKHHVFWIYVQVRIANIRYHLLLRPVKLHLSHTSI